MWNWCWRKYVADGRAEPHTDRGQGCESQRAATARNVKAVMSGVMLIVVGSWDLPRSLWRVGNQQSVTAVITKLQPQRRSPVGEPTQTHHKKLQHFNSSTTKGTNAIKTLAKVVASGHFIVTKIRQLWFSVSLTITGSSCLIPFYNPSHCFLLFFQISCLFFSIIGFKKALLLPFLDLDLIWINW